MANRSSLQVEIWEAFLHVSPSTNFISHFTVWAVTCPALPCPHYHLIMNMQTGAGQIKESPRETLAFTKAPLLFLLLLKRSSTKIGMKSDCPTLLWTAGGARVSGCQGAPSSLTCSSHFFSLGGSLELWIQPSGTGSGLSFLELVKSPIGGRHSPYPCQPSQRIMLWGLVQKPRKAGGWETRLGEGVSLHPPL